jgi:hypothetical protein
MFQVLGRYIHNSRNNPTYLVNSHVCDVRGSHHKVLDQVYKPTAARLEAVEVSPVLSLELRQGRVAETGLPSHELQCGSSLERATG